MNILNLDHAALRVKDVKRSRQFYKQILGMDEIDSGGNCWLVKGNAQIHLLGSFKEEETQQVLPQTYSHSELINGHTTHLALEVDDVQKAEQHLLSHRIEIVCGPRPRYNGGEQLYFCDPDGYVVELFTR